MPHINRIKETAINPTPEQIEEECRMIRAHWSPEISEKRQKQFRIDTEHQEHKARLRFLRFLAEYAESQS
ncbi:hypothetical protein [Thalassoglobus polymorphus]|uniref:Uncharacterized protein n=1 Tax=Thalassoglobus polymorphus TaxID=2527994 RepID=A0A517QHR2_9PLAN|nr:hypothetical protein [Thalassoglobus polymorphus]QDT31172.1 hypothetical protein Mal48_04040 [Thalassoglobus polymorphus]